MAFVMLCRWARSVALCVAVLGVSGLAQAAAPVPVSTVMNEEIVSVPIAAGMFGMSTKLVTTVYRPPGQGPFPVVLMNHGTSNPQNTAAQGRARYEFLALELLRRGYAVVIPMRKGYAGSGGFSGFPGCDGHKENGEQLADEMSEVLAWVRQQPWADTGRLVVGGQSHGGLVALALGARNIPGMRGVINFAGVFKVCRQGEWEPGMLRAMEAFGKGAKVPSLWFYGDNDSFTSSPLANEAVATYNNAGGRARLVSFGKFGSNAHLLVYASDGNTIWLPELLAFLKELELPTEVVWDLPASAAWVGTPIPAATGFANLADFKAVPGLDAAGKSQYRRFLRATKPRAFALGKDGVWSFVDVHKGHDPLALALEECAAKNGGEPCRLYAVDDSVVW